MQLRNTCYFKSVGEDSARCPRVSPSRGRQALSRKEERRMPAMDAEVRRQAVVKAMLNEAVALMAKDIADAGNGMNVRGNAWACIGAHSRQVNTACTQHNEHNDDKHSSHDDLRNRRFAAAEFVFVGASSPSLTVSLLECFTYRATKQAFHDSLESHVPGCRTAVTMTHHYPGHCMRAARPEPSI